MEDIIYECSYNVQDLEPIYESLNLISDSLNVSLHQLIQNRVYSEWILGLNIVIVSLLVIIIFSIFFTNYK